MPLNQKTEMRKLVKQLEASKFTHALTKTLCFLLMHV